MDRYDKLALECGVQVKLKNRATPYKCEPVHEHRLPTGHGPCVACPWCQTPFAPEELRQYASVHELDAEKRATKKRIRDELEQWKAERANPSYGVRKDAGEESCRDRKDAHDVGTGGRLASIASKKSDAGFVRCAVRTL